MSGEGAFARAFGKNLARCRKRIGVSQEELGLMAGLHRTAVGQLERGERVARSDTLVKLCSSLGVGSEELLAGLGWRPQQLFVGELEIEEDEPSETSETKAPKEAIESGSQSENESKPEAQRAQQ